MPRRRSLATMEKDAKAADLFRRGLSYRQIAAECGWTSPASAVEAVRRAVSDAARDSMANDQAFSLMLERLQDYRRQAWRVVSTKHYATNQAGNVVRHPDTGQPMLDDDPVLRGLDRLVKFDELEAKLRGLYAPARKQVEVIGEDVVDAAIVRLEAEMDGRDRDHSGTG